MMSLLFWVWFSCGIVGLRGIVFSRVLAYLKECVGNSVCLSFSMH